MDSGCQWMKTANPIANNKSGWPAEKTSCEADRSFERLSFNGAAGQPFLSSDFMPAPSTQKPDEPLSWKEAQTIAAKLGMPLLDRYGMDGLRVIIRALQRLTTAKQRPAK